MQNPIAQSKNSDNHIRLETSCMRPAVLVELHKMGFKVIPLSSDHEVVMSWTPIYDDSNIWSFKKLINDHSRFRNVATVFGKTHIKDKNGQDLFLSGFDCDSDFVYQILTSEIRNPELNSKVHYLISNFGAPNSDFAASASSLLDLLIQITVVVKTGKECGYHFYWFSHKQNGHIKTEDCVAGRQFEIKTDKASGHSTLPPSSYRKNPQVKYRYITKRDKIAVLDELYEILNELLADCLLTKDNNNNYGSHRNADNKKLDVFYQTNPIILKNDQIMESVSQLVSCYQEHHRNDIVFEFGGLSFKQHIAEVSAIAIIKELCKQTNDSEIDNRLDTIHRTYVNGANGYNISGSSGLKKVIVGVQDYDGEKAEQIILSLIDIWHKHEIPLDSLRLGNIPSLSDEQLDKIKITSKDIEYCINTILKEAPNEQIPVRQLFVGICSSPTHIPQNIGIRTQSGAGKNYLLNKVIAKFPQHNIVNLSDMTPKALFHDQGISCVKNLKTGEYEL